MAKVAGRPLRPSPRGDFLPDWAKCERRGKVQRFPLPSYRIRNGARLDRLPPPACTP